MFLLANSIICYKYLLFYNCMCLIAGLRITNKMRTSVFAAILKQDIAFFDKNKTGELINRLSADTTLVSQSVTMNVSDGLRSTFLVAAGVSMMVR